MFFDVSTSMELWVDIHVGKMVQSHYMYRCMSRYIQLVQHSWNRAAYTCVRGIIKEAERKRRG